VWALKALLFLARLSLCHLGFARNGFHEEPMIVLRSAQDPVVIGSVRDAQVIGVASELCVAFGDCRRMCDTVRCGMQQCGEENAAWRSAG
jgi:hypothetical protein